MKTYECIVCGEIFTVADGEEVICPVCGVGEEECKLVEAPAEEVKPEEKSGKTYKCLVCDAEFTVADGEEIVCPVCGVGEDMCELIG